MALPTQASTKQSSGYILAAKYFKYMAAEFAVAKPRPPLFRSSKELRTLVKALGKISEAERQAVREILRAIEVVLGE